MSRILSQSFFSQDAKIVAPDLLKSDLVKKINGKKVKFEINEIEIYEGFKDKASHASRKKTERNKLMFEKGGIFYIYLIYGMYFMLNVVVGKKDYPAAILIRGADKFNGPGKLTKALKVDFSLNGKKAKKENGLWFEKNEKKIKIKRLPRVGVDYAGEYWKNAPLRLVKIN